MVLRYDVGRLLFIANTASQIAGLRIHTNIPRTRFTVDTLDLAPSLMIHIHLISIGGRSYISNLSSGSKYNTILCYDIRRCDYLATKSDGIGIVDIAFEQEKGLLKWILQNSTEPFTMELSHNKNASLHRLRIVRDALKCRAIIPSNRASQPYFYKPPFPPNDYTVNPGFLLESELVKRKDPFIYFTQATYVPFENVTRVSLDYHFRQGFEGVYVNDPKWKDKHSVTFNEPQKRLIVKFLFKVNNQWAPAIPHGIIAQEILVQDVVGLWLGNTYEFTPPHIGMVVSQPHHSTKESTV